jgi:hypothetical protein
MVMGPQPHHGEFEALLAGKAEEEVFGPDDDAPGQCNATPQRVAALAP